MRLLPLVAALLLSPAPDCLAHKGSSLIKCGIDQHYAFPAQHGGDVKFNTRKHPCGLAGTTDCCGFADGYADTLKQLERSAHEIQRQEDGIAKLEAMTARTPDQERQLAAAKKMVEQERKLLEDNWQWDDDVRDMLDQFRPLSAQADLNVTQGKLDASNPNPTGIGGNFFDQNRDRAELTNPQLSPGAMGDLRPGGAVGGVTVSQSAAPISLKAQPYGDEAAAGRWEAGKKSASTGPPPAWKPVQTRPAKQLEEEAAKVKDEGGRPLDGGKRAESAQASLPGCDTKLVDAKAIWGKIMKGVLGKEAYEDAEQDADAAVACDPKNAAAWQVRAFAQLRQGKFAAAIDSATKAIQLASKAALSWLIRAYAKDALGDRTGALADLKQAAELDGRYGELFRIASQGGRIFEPSLSDVDLLTGNRQRYPLWQLLAATLAALSLGLLLGGRKKPEPAKPRPEPAAARAAPKLEAPGPAPKPEPAAAPPAALIADKYEKRGLLFEGDLGEVFDGFDRPGKAPVALKRLASPKPAAPQSRQLLIRMLLHEAATPHDSIVKVLDACENDGDVWAVLERLEGKTLRRVVAERGRLNLEAAAAILSPVCQALQFAQQVGMLFPQLPPSEILIGANGRPKIFVPALMRTPDSVGSRPYAAPEAESRGARPESVVYSLGLCLYEMITGKPAFGLPPDLDKKAKMEFALPSAAQPSIPKEVDALIQDALQPDPDRRTKTPSAFFAGFQALALAKAP